MQPAALACPVQQVQLVPQRATQVLPVPAILEQRLVQRADLRLGKGMG